MNEVQVNGIDTIQGLEGEMPKKIEIPFSIQYTQHTLQQGWNKIYMAIVPYCFKCKVPLVWHTHPKDILYHCPNCGTQWIKAKGWDESEAKAKIIKDMVGEDK